MLLTFTTDKKKPTLKDASEILHVKIEDLDTNFGVVEVDPSIHEYCVLSKKEYPDHPKGFKNVKIQPFDFQEKLPFKEVLIKAKSWIDQIRITRVTQAKDEENNDCILVYYKKNDSSSLNLPPNFHGYKVLLCQVP